MTYQLRPQFNIIFCPVVKPETFWIVFNEFIRNQLLGHFIHSLKEKDPLTNLEGIDLYDRTRLAEEGVTNVESLAHHNMIDLILSTRIPVPRLIDWLDQAILYLHLPSDHVNDKKMVDGDNGEAKRLTTWQQLNTFGIRASNGEAKPFTMRQQLKTFGIRTATDFIDAYNAAEKRNDLTALLWILDEPHLPNEAPKPPRIQTIYDTLLDDEWVSCIIHWRKAIDVAEILKPV